MNMLQIFFIGDEIHGYCGGEFGRDDYASKICVLVTPEYALFQYENGTAAVLNYEEGFTKEMAQKWRDDEPYE